MKKFLAFFLLFSLVACAQEPQRKAYRAPSDLPPAVQETYNDIIDAAQTKDFKALKKVIEQGAGNKFIYNVNSQRYGAISDWRRYEPNQKGEDFFEELISVMQTKYRFDGQNYVWPGFFLIAPNDLSASEIREWKELMGEENYRNIIESGRGYIGMRLGIRKDGAWMYYVGGDKWKKN